MRFISVSDIREGMTLGKSLYNREGVTVLSEGHVLTPRFVKSIKELGYNGIYINSDSQLMEDVKGAISESLKAGAIQSVKTLFRVATGENSVITDDELMKELQEKVVEIIDNILNNETVLYNLIDLKIYDDYTYHHSVNVAVLSIVMGIYLKLSKDDLKELALSALIHDIGKVFIPNEILNKQGILTAREFKEMKHHVIKGSDFVSSKLNISERVALGLLEHHEKWDGSGYPHGKIRNEISLFGRIISVADVYDALTSNRPYRDSLTPSDAFEYVIAHAGTHFDPKIIDVFFENIAPYPIGTNVVLSNGEEGFVVKLHKKFLMRPDVQIGNKVVSMISDREYLKVTVLNSKK